MTTGSKLQCARECSNLGSQCKAFSYNEVDSECQLGSCITPSLNVTDDLAWRYMSAPICQDVTGFRLINSGVISACIWLSSDMKTYSNAASDCRAKGAHLYTVKSSFKMKILLLYNTEYWVGLNDIQVEGVYRWIDDGSIISQSQMKEYFMAGEPNNANNDEDCIVYNYGNSRALNDIACSVTKKYICELDCHKLT
ncbi:C-type lectin domain 4 member M [Bulinus truncatus]|nr:C-type lectin domain 4 member M [Bulinus truncatus]